MYNDHANFEATVVAAPAVYRRFTFHDLYMRRAKGKKDGNQAILVDSEGGAIRTHHHAIRAHHDNGGIMAVHNWEVYDGPGPGANIVAHARGLHIDTGAGFFHNSFTFVFEHRRFKGSTLQAMGVAPKEDDEYSIVGRSGAFAMANGVVRRVLYRREGKTEIDRLTIKGLIPIFDETAITGTSSSSAVQNFPGMNLIHRMQ